MSLHLYLSSTGERLLVDLREIYSLDNLKTWIEQSTEVPVGRQILMTAKGKNIKQQNLIPETKVFVYDKAFLSGDKPLSIPGDDDNDKNTIPDPGEFPSVLEDEQSLAAWQELFMLRRTWALEVVDIVKSAVSKIDHQVEQCEVLEGCTQVALENLQNHFRNLQDNSEKTFTWARNVVAEHSDMLQEWRESANTLAELPVRDEIAVLLSMRVTTQSSETNGTMLGMLDQTTLGQAAGTLQIESDKFKSDLDNLQQSMVQLQNSVATAMKLGNIDWPQLNVGGVVLEVEALASKISRDYEEVLQMRAEAKSVPLASRRAVTHTQNLLPALQQISQEVRKTLEDLLQHRDQLVENCTQALRQISTIQSQAGNVQTEFGGLKVSENGERNLEALDKIFRLPVAYGSTMIEAIRRSEWNDKMHADLGFLRDDISRSREDEAKRRKKWAASLDGFLDETTQAADTLVDLSFTSPSNKWPFVSREEIFAYIDDLRALNVNDAVKQVTLLLKDLETIVKSKKPKPRVSAFKNGSVYDLGQSISKASDEETKALQEDKIRLEDKMRASESRIRKLEDLLHRQNQVTQPFNGTLTPQTDIDRSGPSPGPAFNRSADALSRRPSVSLRRLSNQTLDEKAMVQRIVSLEGQISKLQQEAHVERRASMENRDKLNEVESVKRDLMANFEAQRQEFDDERQLLDDENHKLKVRLEEVEDELDRVLGSRDHQRMTQEQIIANLRSELEQIAKSSSEESEKLRHAKDKLQQDLVGHRDKISNLERSIQQHKDDKSSLHTHNMGIAAQLRSIESQQQDVLLSLQAAHSSLSPTGTVPEDLKSLVRALELLAEGAAIHARNIDDALQLATAENKARATSHASLESQYSQANKQLDLAKKENAELREEASQGRNRLNTVRSELATDRMELQNLREKFAAGETGSGVLRTRLAVEEKRVAELTEAINLKDATLEGLQHNIDTSTKNSQASQEVLQQLKSHLASRNKKTRELSERLFQQNDRVIRMLENFGYSVTRQDATLVIQRASKVNSSTLLISGEGGSPMKRTVSGSIPVQHYSDDSDLEALYWASDEDSVAEENQYQAFIKGISRLDLDGSLETLTKRYKDVELFGKKYQKDSRASRDRCHRLQSEAHDKIAYRSFKEGDLALFLPTRNQATKAWAAFNVGAPHYFLKEQDVHRLQTREWLLARITKIEQRVVDLSRSLSSTKNNAGASDDGSVQSIDENPFDLSDGLLWHYIDAVEEKPGAPSTPHIGKSTTTASIIEVKGHMSRKILTGKEASDGSAVSVAKSLSKSLDSRRSSEASRKGSALQVGTLKNQGSGSSGVHAAALAATGNTSVAAGTEGEAERSMTSTATPSVQPDEGADQAGSKGKVREDAKVFEVDSQSGHPPKAPVSVSRVDSARQLQSPSKQTSSPAKRSWDKLWSIEYRA